ncbi:MAG: DUF2442 domain-containing protein [Bacteroidota bacterium]
MFPIPVQIKPLNSFHLWIQYSDGTQGELNLSYLVGKGVFKALESENLFDKVYIDKETKAIAWNETLELCPDSLYLRLKGITFEQWKEMQDINATN